MSKTARKRRTLVHFEQLEQRFLDPRLLESWVLLSGGRHEDKRWQSLSASCNSMDIVVSETGEVTPAESDKPESFFDLFVGIRQAREEMDKHAKVLELSMKVSTLEQRVDSLEGTLRDHHVWITTLDPKPYSLLRNIPVLVEPVLPDEGDEDCSYVARFVEAGVGASGDTVEETISFLKDRLISSFEALSNMPSEKLGELPRRRLAALRAVMKRSSTWRAEAETKSQSSSQSTSRRSSRRKTSATKATSMTSTESSMMTY